MTMQLSKTAVLGVPISPVSFAGAQDRCRHGHTRRRTRGLDARKLGHSR
jgi:hypothetical protein